MPLLAAAAGATPTAAAALLAPEEYIELGATLATALNARHLLLATEDADEAARPALAAAHGLTLVVQPCPRAFSDATGLGDCDGDGVGGSRADVFTDRGGVDSAPSTRRA